MMWGRQLILLAILAFAAHPAPADTIVLRNGQTLDGVIEQETDSLVLLRMPGGQLSLSRTQIESIQRATASQNTALVVEGHLRNENPLRAFEELAALAERGASEDFPDIIARLGEPLAGQAGMLSPGDRTRARHFLQTIEPTVSTHPQAMLSLARLYVAIEAGERASEALVAADLDWVRDNESARSFALPFLRAHIRNLVAQSRFAEAVEQIERLRLLDDAAAENQLPLLLLTRSARAREAGSYELALQLLAEELYPLSPEVARNRVVVTLRFLAPWAELNQQEREARRWIRQYALPLVPVESLAFSHQLYYTEAERILRESRPSMALRLIEQVPQEEWSESLRDLAAQAEFELKVEEAGDDAAALFEVGLWAADNKLYDQAFFLFEDLREVEGLQPLADAQMAMLKEERDMLLLQDALEAYHRGLLRESIAIAQQIQNIEGRESPLVADARDLEKLARGELKYAEERKPYEAEILYQQAERAYFTDNIDESFNLIDVLLTNFADTPAAQRATRLLPDVVRQFELQIVEGRRKTVPSYEQTVSHADLMRSEQLDTEIRALLQSLEIIDPDARAAAEPPEPPVEALP